QSLCRRPSPPSRRGIDDRSPDVSFARCRDAASSPVHRPCAGLARLDRFSPRGTARRRVPPLGAGVDLCRDAGTGARRPDRTPPGSSVRSDLPAQRCIRPGRRGVRVNASADERTRQRRLLEAVLFAAAEPLTEEELTERLSEGVELGLLLVELAE